MRFRKYYNDVMFEGGALGYVWYLWNSKELNHFWKHYSECREEYDGPSRYKRNLLYTNQLMEWEEINEGN